MIKNIGFETIIANDDEHKELFCEIYFDGLLFAVVTQEEIGKFDVETPGPNLNESAIIRSVNLTDFQSALEDARRRLTGEQQ